jgi:hypothetical protein
MANSDDPRGAGGDHGKPPAECRRPSRGKSLAILMLLAVAFAVAATFVLKRSDPSRENDPRLTAPTRQP